MKTNGLRRSFSRVFSSAIGVLLFFSCTPFVFAETIRQPVADSFAIPYTGQTVHFAFVAPVSGYIYSLVMTGSALFDDVYFQQAEFCDFGGVTNCRDAVNVPQHILSETQYVFDFTQNPKQIVAGVSYEVVVAFSSIANHFPNDIGALYGSNATTTVFVGSTGTTTAYCRGGGCPSGMVVPQFVMSTSPLNFSISTLYPASTSTVVSLITAQSYCGSESFATTTGFFDTAAQDFSRGLCLSFAYLFVPNSESLASWTGLTDVLQTKIPFSYVYGIRDIFAVLSASSTANVPAFVFHLPALGSTSPIGTLYPTTIVGLSSTTIGTYLDEGTRQDMLGLQRVALWVGLAYMFYRRIIPHHVFSNTV